MIKPFQKKYFPNLNATRFLAFVPVFLTHCFYTNDPQLKATAIYSFVQDHLKLGLLALDYFFVLSSFLISWIIYEELEMNGSFSIRNFYIRRSLRIFPLYFLVVLFGFTLYYGSVFLDLHSISQLPSFHHFLFFTLNFYMMNYGMNFLFFLTFFWSVSVEEQFYVFWALVLKFIQRFDVIISVILIVSSLIFRYVNIHDNPRLVFHTLSSLANFGVGNLLCIAFYKHREACVTFINAMSISLKRMIYLLFAGMCLCYNDIFCVDSMVVIERLVFALFFAFVIADLAFSKKPSFQLERIRWMDYFGQLSFGLYCYHGIILTAAYFILQRMDCLSSPWLVFVVTPIILFGSTLLAAHLSYRWIEKPILKLKRNFY